MENHQQEAKDLTESLTKSLEILQRVIQAFSDTLEKHRELMTHPEEPLSCAYLAGRIKTLDHDYEVLAGEVRDIKKSLDVAHDGIAKTQAVVKANRSMIREIQNGRDGKV